MERFFYAYKLSLNFLLNYYFLKEFNFSYFSKFSKIIMLLKQLILNTLHFIELNCIYFYLDLI